LKTQFHIGFEKRFLLVAGAVFIWKGRANRAKDFSNFFSAHLKNKSVIISKRSLIHFTESACRTRFSRMNPSARSVLFRGGVCGFLGMKRFGFFGSMGHEPSDLKT
jgi:hypothetical protein